MTVHDLSICIPSGLERVAYPLHSQDVHTQAIKTMTRSCTPVANFDLSAIVQWPLQAASFLGPSDPSLSFPLVQP